MKNIEKDAGVNMRSGVSCTDASSCALEWSRVKWREGRGMKSVGKLILAEQKGRRQHEGRMFARAML